MLVGVGITLVTDGFGTFRAAEPRPDVVPAAVEATPEQARARPAEGPEPRPHARASRPEGPGPRPNAATTPPPVDLSQLQSQIAELERILRARKERDEPQAPERVESALAELTERQGRTGSGQHGEREREIDREAERRALEMVQEIRLDIDSKTKERERILKEIMESNR